MSRKKVLLAPLDPVHDIGLKMIKRGLEQNGHDTILMPPDHTQEEIIKAIIDNKADVVLISLYFRLRCSRNLGQIYRPG